jgi:drug/metabolite transporter (DMT)-like permease
MSPTNAPQQVKMDAAIAGPLFMLAAALLFTMLNLLIKQIGPAFTIWHIGFYRFFGGVAVLLWFSARHGNPYRGHNTRLLIIGDLPVRLPFFPSSRPSACCRCLPPW